MRNLYKILKQVIVRLKKRKIPSLSEVEKRTVWQDIIKREVKNEKKD